MAKPVLTVAQNAVLTTSGNSTGIAVQPIGNVGGAVSCHVAVTAVSGSSPTLVVSLQWSGNNSTWVNANADETFATITSPGAVLLTVPSRAPLSALRGPWPAAPHRSQPLSHSGVEENLMKVRVKVQPSGLLNGSLWPEVGETVDLPESASPRT
jgi:hypothetical protein